MGFRESKKFNTRSHSQRRFVNPFQLSLALALPVLALFVQVGLNLKNELMLRRASIKTQFTKRDIS